MSEAASRMRSAASEREFMDCEILPRAVRDGQPAVPDSTEKAMAGRHSAGETSPACFLVPLGDWFVGFNEMPSYLALDRAATYPWRT